MAPPYLSELWILYIAAPADPRHQRAPSTVLSDSRYFDVPWCRLSTYGRRAFSCAGPTAWNSLPDRL